MLAYIARDDPDAAARVVGRFDKTVRNLAAMPTGRRGRVAGTYEKPVPRLPYIVAYALRDGPGGIAELVVLRVVHGARDWPPGRWPRNSQPDSE
jgi:plasmid stabilization system protein ParE